MTSEVTVFVGTDPNPRRGVTATTGLYEFRTDAGAHIHLHDADLVRVTYQPAAQPTLILDFVFDAEWVPGQLRETPVVRFFCHGVRIVSWTDDPKGHAALARDPDAPAGQVSGFDWNGFDMFTLDSFITQLTFTAARIVVTAHSQPGGARSDRHSGAS